MNVSVLDKAAYNAGPFKIFKTGREFGVCEELLVDVKETVIKVSCGEHFLALLRAMVLRKTRWIVGVPVGKLTVWVGNSQSPNQVLNGQTELVEIPTTSKGESLRHKLRQFILLLSCLSASSNIIPAILNQISESLSTNFEVLGTSTGLENCADFRAATAF